MSGDGSVTNWILELWAGNHGAARRCGKGTFRGWSCWHGKGSLAFLGQRTRKTWPGLSTVSAVALPWADFRA